MKYHTKALPASNYFYIISLRDLKFPPQSKITMVTLSSPLTMSLTLRFIHVYFSPFSKADRDLSHFRLSAHATYFLAWNSLPFLYLENFHYCQVSGNTTQE